MNDTASDRRSPVATVLPAVALAAAVFALAYLSPVEDVGADPAIALLASQAFLDHGTWRLDPYHGDPRCAYDLETDYRIRRQGGHFAYYNLSVPVLSLPAVWLANRFGHHMLDQASEFALQNLLSALCCAAIASALFLLCRCYLAPAPSLVVAAIMVFGSSLTSTLATGLWNLDYAVAVLAAGLLYAVRRSPEAPHRGPHGVRPGSAEDPPAFLDRTRWIALALLSMIAFLCRPTAGFAIAAAVLAFGVLESRRRARRWLAAGAGLAVVLAGLWALGWIPEGLYYTPRKLLPRTPPWIGLYGNLLSPSRGLLLFSPFVLVIAAGAALRWRRLWERRLFRFAALWIALQLWAVSVKQTWWGGHSYGPRLLTELMLPLTLVACLLWRPLADAPRRWRRGLAAAFLVLGAAAIAIHSVQGLFNPAVQQWNVSPDVDREPEVLFDWRTPQFLASAGSVAARLEAHQRGSLLPYHLGQPLGPDARAALFRGWYDPEGGWRWSEGTAPEIVLALSDTGAADLAGVEICLLELTAGTQGHQAVAVSVNGTAVGRFVGRGFEPSRRLFAFPAGLLTAGSDNVVRFDVPAAASTAEDARLLGLALRSMTVLPLPADFPGVGFEDDVFFADGWSVAEPGWRWTDGPRATVLYPMAAVGGDAATLEIDAGAFGEQRVRLRIDGVPAGELRFAGSAPESRRLIFDAGLLRPYAVHRVELEISAAASPAGDSRLLGLSLVRLAIRSGPPP